MDTNLIIGIVAAVVIVVLLIVCGVVRGKSRKNEVVGRPAETVTSPRQAGRAGEEPETVAATVDRQLSAPETEGETASPRSEEERKPVEPTQAAPAKPAAPAYDVPEESGSRIQRLKAKLSKSSNPFGKALFNILTKDNLSESDWEDVEDTLLLADVGAEASEQLVGELRRDARITGKASPDEVRATLRDNLLDLVGRDTDRRLNVDKPDAHKPGVIIMVGVNGTGKTTTAGKLARLFVSEDKKVVMGAADTFRAAAADQLETWGARVNVPVVRSDKDGADPASVAFEAAARAKEDDADVLIIDTAGRLQNKSNLMDELGKIRRVTEKNLPVDEVLLVLDATTGQNGMAQAKVFAEAIGLTASCSPSSTAPPRAALSSPCRRSSACRSSSSASAKGRTISRPSTRKDSSTAFSREVVRKPSDMNPASRQSTTWTAGFCIPELLPAPESGRKPRPASSRFT